MTPKTLADVKGGTLISYEGKVQVYKIEFVDWGVSVFSLFLFHHVTLFSSYYAAT